MKPNPSLVLLLLAFTAVALMLPCGLQAADAPQLGLTGEGVLIVTAAQDTSAGFRWQEGPGEGRLSLIWPEGRLNIPADLAMQSDTQGDLGIPLLRGFGGTGPDGDVTLDDGVLRIHDSLAFTDGRLQWVVSGGKLEIAGNQLRYLRPAGTGGPEATRKSREMKANLLMIAGLLLLIAVLLRRARSKTRRKS